MSACAETLESRGGSEREEGKAGLGTHYAARRHPWPLCWCISSTSANASESADCSASTHLQFARDSLQQLRQALPCHAADALPTLTDSPDFGCKSKTHLELAGHSLQQLRQALSCHATDAHRLLAAGGHRTNDCGVGARVHLGGRKAGFDHRLEAVVRATDPCWARHAAGAPGPNLLQQHGFNPKRNAQTRRTLLHTFSVGLCCLRFHAALQLPTGISISPCSKR